MKFSDIGPQFIAQQFQEFCKCNGIKHSRTPPYHPASNGAAESSTGCDECHEKDEITNITIQEASRIFTDI